MSQAFADVQMSLAFRNADQLKRSCTFESEVFVGIRELAEGNSEAGRRILLNLECLLSCLCTVANGMS